MKPNIIKDYNNGVLGIDRSDKMLSYYLGMRKSVWWNKNTGNHFIRTFEHD